MQSSDRSAGGGLVDTVEHADDAAKKQTPLPWSQLFIIYFIHFTEAVTRVVIYPFINQFIRETGITGGDEKKTGYFAGIIDSAFFFTEALTVVGFGMASDRFGRRLLLVWGPLGLSLAMLGFGMSTQFWLLVVFRCLQGASNGNTGVSRAVIAELTDSTNIAGAFALASFSWSAGGIVGPFLGGLLSRPADRWPNTLGRLAYLQSHPYYLPCLAASAIAFASFLAALIYLKEASPLIRKTKQAKKVQASSAPTPSTRLVASNDVVDYGSSGELRREACPSPDFERCLTQDDSGDLTPPAWRDLLTREVAIVLVNYGFCNFVVMALNTLIPLTWSTSIEHGGLGFTPYKIGLTLGTYGAVNALFQLSLLGPIIKWFGPKRVCLASAASFLLSFGAFPLQILLAKRAGGADWKVWCVIVVQIFSRVVEHAAFSALHIMIQGVTPSRSALGVTNGLGQAVGTITRAFAPAAVSSLYAASLQYNLAGGNAVYYIMLVTVACAMPLPFLLPTKLRLD